jgi:hypothetical protein
MRALAWVRDAEGIQSGRDTTAPSEAFAAGQITAGQFDQRSGQALRARTGKELTVLPAGLPHHHARADTTPRQARRQLTPRILIGPSAAAATSLAALAIANAPRHAAPGHRNRQLAQEIPARTGLNVPLPPRPPAPGLNRAGTITPAAIAALLMAAIIAVLPAARTSHRDPRTPARQPSAAAASCPSARSRHRPPRHGRPGSDGPAPGRPGPAARADLSHHGGTVPGHPRTAPEPAGLPRS